MNNLALLALLGSTATADVVYNALDDPRCHVEPNRPVLEPTPSPSPFPDPPGTIVEYAETTAPTPTPLCPGMVTGFQIKDLSGSAAPVPIEDGMTLALHTLPAEFTVEAIVEDGVTAVKFYLNDAHVRNDHTASDDFTFSEGAFSDLLVEGDYEISAYAEVNGAWEPVEDECALSITVDYANPAGLCEGLITKFALYDTAAQAIVPGYDVLADGQELELVDLPDNLSIIAIDNGRGGDEVTFYVDLAESGSMLEFGTVTGTPFGITGNAGNNVPEWTQLRETGTYTISAKMKNAMGDLEPTECMITISVDSDWICHNEVEGFSLIDTTTDEVVPGYAHMTGGRTIDLAEVGDMLSLRINKKRDPLGVKIYKDSRYYRTENWAPFALNGDADGDYHASDLLATPGIYHFEARGKAPGGSWEPRGDACRLSITVVDSSTPTVSHPPGTTLELLTAGDGDCAAKLVTPVTAGNHQYWRAPVEVEEADGETVKFKVFNYIKNTTIDWITTSFVTPSGVEVCDKVDNVDFQAEAEHVYEAKCHEGYAYADIFAYSTTFSAAQASADTSLLPDACKNDFDGQVVRYTFVFSCTCDEIPEEIVGGIPTEQLQCSGSVGNVWGDPHVQPYDGGQWDCQGTGEFKLAEAELTNYDYNFEAQARFWRFGLTGISYSWTTGLALKQDVTVQVTIGEEELEGTTMFEDLPVNFYVDGTLRRLTEGSGDHRVIVTVDGFNIYIYFVTTGIAATIYVRPNSVSAHINTIPGSLTAYICLPYDNPNIVNVKGLLGTPNDDTADDWMNADGTAWTGGSNAFDYCTDTWCIRDVNDSLFTYNDGYLFDHYEKCDDPRNTRHLSEVDTSTASQEILNACQDVVDYDGYDSCLYEGIVMGEDAADAAADAIEKLEGMRTAALRAQTPDDAACCSSDYKTCAEGAGATEYDCGLNCDDTFLWLPQGEYTDRDDHGNLVDCLVKEATCTDTDDCCPGLLCSSGTCTPFTEACPTGSASGSRRLEEWVFERPDLPMDRNVITFADLL